jgi:hypothetical protein
MWTNGEAIFAAITDDLLAGRGASLTKTLGSRGK